MLLNVHTQQWLGLAVHIIPLTQALADAALILVDKKVHSNECSQCCHATHMYGVPQALLLYATAGLKVRRGDQGHCQ